MTPEQNAINKLIWQLDQVALEYEARWGVYTLESFAPEILASKFQAQLDKLNEAIGQNDPAMVAARVEGMIKGYKALEQSALSLGHKPCEPSFLEINVNSKIYRVVKSVAEARALHRPDGDKDVSIVTIEELVNIHQSKHDEIVKKVKEARPENDSWKTFDFEKGDSVEF
jgi:hypothetical protein